MRLSIDISPEQHQFLKAAAAIHGKTIKDYVLDSALPTEQEQKAFKQLESLLLERKNKALTGELSSKSVDEIFDEELGL
ncbi:DUF1778 domain-containing protein [Ningiella sp. W23]|uniref:type II toxin -antitoxin system TacA 1-like antitoxin n=1 Tax=Ningiella sp. W23 TaxID=3023715 RepID=UPI003757626D